MEAGYSRRRIFSEEFLGAFYPRVLTFDQFANNGRVDVYCCSGYYPYCDSYLSQFIKEAVSWAPVLSNAGALVSLAGCRP